MKSRLSADQAVPVGKEKLLMIGAWAEVLEDIPDELLEEYYLRASKAKTNGFPVNALDIIAAWNERAETRRWEAMIDPEQQRKFLQDSGRIRD